MNKKVIYTALYGQKDSLKDPLHISDGFDYICFTDDPNLESSVWSCIYSEPTSEDPVRSAKVFKLLPYKHLAQYEVSIWVDANFIIHGDINDFLDKIDNLQGVNMAMFQHDQGRNCLYDEATIICQTNRDDPDVVTRQMDKYRSVGYPPQHGLTACSIIVRRHHAEDIIKFSDAWWAEVEEFSRRDQLSCCYCLWRHDIKYGLLNYPAIDIRRNNWFHWAPHNFETQSWSF